MTSPRLPYKPLSSSCDSQAGTYTKGQSAKISCTQSFDAIPVGYVNIVSAFDQTAQPLGFSFKIPLGLINLVKE
jgi:hypothetical protein